MLLFRSALLIGVAVATLQNPAEDVCSVCRCKGNTADCSNETISSLPSFEKDADATIILFANCQFVSVQQLPKLPVRSLSFAHNDVVKIEDAAFKNLPSLQSLDLSFNLLTADALLPNVFRGNFAPDQYEPLRSLKELNLAYNQLHTLHPDAFVHLVNLEVLKLNGNPLKIITFGVIKAISSLPFLKELDLSRTSIKAIPENLFHAPKYLEVLDLSYNLFAKPPIELETTHRLRRLSLDGNPIKRIRTFINLPYLKVLRISNMPELASIEERSLSDLPMLEELYCSDNRKLVKIAKNALSAVRSDEEGESWPLLNVLVLRNNSLQSIERHFVARWDHLKVINLQDNPWMCDCENQWLVSTLAPIIEKTQPEMFASFKCHNPIERRGISIATLSTDDLCYVPKRHTDRNRVLIGVYSCIVIVFFAIAMAILYYKKTIKNRTIPYNEMFKVKYKPDLYAVKSEKILFQIECGGANF